MKTELMLLLMLNAAQTAVYYADISVSVDSSGFTTIQGNTDYPSLITTASSEYTSKNKDYWTLNITKNETFSEFIYEVKLPEGSSINYIKSTGTVGIENSGSNLIIKGFGENSLLSIVVQYKVAKSEDYTFFIALGAAAIIAASVMVFFTRKSKAAPAEKIPKKRGVDMLPERQKKIIELLTKHGRPMTQSQIQKELSLPKASASRNIKSLELNGYVVKENIGITNMIKLT